MTEAIADLETTLRAADKASAHYGLHYQYAHTLAAEVRRQRELIDELEQKLSDAEASLAGL